MSEHSPLTGETRPTGHVAQKAPYGVSVTADKDATLWFCGCKATAGRPLCDGAHKRL